MTRAATHFLALAGRDIGIAITDQNAWTERNGPRVLVPSFMKEILEEIARLARSSPAVNQQAGLSVRTSIARNPVSTERYM